METTTINDVVKIVEDGMIDLQNIHTKQLNVLKAVIESQQEQIKYLKEEKEKLRASSLEWASPTDIISEIRKCGFRTDLLFSRHDIERQLEYINGLRGKAYQIPIEELDLDEILDRAIDKVGERVCERINEEIQSEIFDYYTENKKV